MTDTLLLFLPAQGLPWRWLRIADGAVVGRGEGFPVTAEGEESRFVAIAPADSVTLHWAELPDRALAQSVAAARILASEASATPLGALHVAVGREGANVERPIGVVAVSDMQAWLGLLAANGVDPDAIIPAPMLLPRPEAGYLRADLGGEGAVRGPTSGFADEARLTELITGGVAPTVLTRDALEAAIVAAVATPPLDLRQGIFVKKVRLGVDWALVRRIGWLIAAVIAASVLITLVQLLKYTTAADELERRTDLLARSGLSRGEAVNDADRQLTARLGRLRGAGLGFSRTAAAVFAAIRATPGTETRSLAFDEKGALRITLVTQNEGQFLDIARHLDAAGLNGVVTGQVSVSGGRYTGDMMVSPR